MNKALKILLCLLAITPVLVDVNVLSPFTAGKSFFVYLILSVVSILFAIHFFNDKKFKEEVINRVISYSKNPVVIAIFLFITTLLFSTIFASSKYLAFWGSLDRAEGLVGIISFFSVFVFSSLVFEKKDYLNFFKLSILVASIVLFKEFYEFFITGLGRPNSFLGNPAFLGGYLLFPIFCSIVILTDRINLEKKSVRSINSSSSVWKYFSIITLILSVVGVFISQTRGSILGLVVGFILVLIYGVIKGKDISLWKINIRKFSIIILVSIFIFSALFISTRKNDIWQKVPGLGRVASISSTDSTTQTRLLMVSLGINAVNPIDNGWKKFLIGWGQDNFGIAYLKYFNPVQFDYENSYFDRAHNKFVDILVMNGVFGLLAYLSIFFLFFFYIFKKKEFSWLNVGLLFWGIAYLVHLLFVFDQITTWIPMFLILSYFIFINKKDIIRESKIKLSYVAGSIFIAISLFLNYVFLTNILPSYMQMYELENLLKKNDSTYILNNVNKIFAFSTISLPDVLKIFIEYNQNHYILNNINMNKLIQIGFDKEEEYTKKVPLDLNNKAFLAVSYTNIAKLSGNSIDFLKNGEVYFNELLSTSPDKPDYNYSLGLNLLLQKRMEEALMYLEKSFELSPKYFLSKGKDAEKIYVYLFKYFYTEKNKEAFVKVANRLILNNYSDKENIKNIVNYIEKTKTWPNIDFGN